jgi:phosphate uptake regulator
MADKAIKLKDRIPKESLQRIEKMSQLALTVLGDSVEALLRRDYQLADKTVDNAENIRALEDNVITAMEKDRMHDSANIKLALEDIRRTAEYASDIAEAALNETIDEVIEKHSTNRRK